MRAILKFFSSLKLVIASLVFSMLIVVFGTLDQVDIGIQQAQKKYFDTFIIHPPLGGHTFIEFTDGLPWSGLYSWLFKHVPLPGGYLVGGMLMLSLIAAYFTKFKVGALRVAAVAAICAVETWIFLNIGYSTWPGWLLMTVVTVPNLALVAFIHYKLKWPKVGIMLTHVGVMIMLVGGLLTSIWQRETHMRIDTGATANYSESNHEAELAIVSETDNAQEHVVAIPQSRLAKGGAITDAALPFAVNVSLFYPNSDMVRLPQGEQPPQPVTSGYGLQYKPVPAPLVAKTEERNIPAVYVDLTKDGKSLGKHLVSLFGSFSPDKLPPQKIEVDGKSYELRLRPARFYKEFSLTLIKFSHDKYKGTEKPSNFSSLVELNDPRTGEKKTHLIKMNEPLRYGGETFFQASFLPGNQTTILQVVRNPAVWLPYVSCVVVTLGMMWQFLIHLFRYLGKRQTA